MTIASLADLASTRRLVVKVGSSLLVENGKPRKAWLASLAAELAELRPDTEIVVVSSGAIALGAARLGLPKGGRSSLADAQAAASAGQVELARLWSEAFAPHGSMVAQLLVTLGDLEDRRRYLNASATLGRLIENGAIPVVNENDSVATEEIRFGDNDRLSARVAQAAQADAVVLLSDVDGLFDRPPSEARAELVPLVDGVTEEVAAMASDMSGSGLGTGGMASKIEAARIAGRAGIAMAIVNGTHERPLSRAIERDRGTLFLPQHDASARKAWLGGRLAPAGVLVVDEGCEDALNGGASLLAVGVNAVEGQFDRGDLIAIRNERGDRIGQGLVEYSSEECRAILGRKQGEQEAILGYAPRAAVIHRDHMVHA